MLAKAESWRPLSRRMAELHKANHAQDLQAWQRERMNFLQELKQNLQSEQQLWTTSMNPEIRKLCGHLQGPLIQRVGKLLKLPNRNLATKIHDGFWCYGTVPPTGMWKPKYEPEHESLQVAIDAARLARQKGDYLSSPAPVSKTIF